MSINGNFDCKVELDKPGPIHDVAWSPNSKEFIVVYGAMPAKATVFDHRAAPMYELGSAARNQVRYSPSGRLFYIGGFGNLAGNLIPLISGDMDVWERKTFKKITSIQASNSSTCEWCPDGRHFMTSTLYRRLKVDNGIKIYHYTGLMVAQIDVKEMTQTSWRHDDPELWPERISSSPPPTKGVVAAPSSTDAAKYVPPGARGQPSKVIFDRDAAAKILLEKGSSASNFKKGKKKPTISANEDNQTHLVASVGAVQGGTLETEKKLKNIGKKLKQIADLKAKRDAGQILELTQEQKIANEPLLKKEFDELTASLAL